MLVVTVLLNRTVAGGLVVSPYEYPKQIEYATFSIMAEHMYETSDGNKVVEATWTCVAAFEGKDVNLQSLTRGAVVHLTGRLRTNRYIDASGCEKVFAEVIASLLKVLA